MSQQNRGIVERLNEEAFRQGNVDVIDELVSEDFVEHDPLPGVAPDREGFKELVRAFHRAFADEDYVIHDQLADGDEVAERWTMTATHVGEWLGIPATQKRITVAGMDISRLEGGQIVEHWTQIDTLSMLQQLGAIPSAQAARA